MSAGDNYLDCPLPWCQGFSDEHGGQLDPLDPRPPAERGYPADPATWEHRSAELDLPRVGYGYWESIGSGPARYVIASGDRAIQLVAHSPAELDALSNAETLSDLAAAGRLAEYASTRHALALVTAAGQFAPAQLVDFADALGVVDLDEQSLLELGALSEATQPTDVAELAMVASSRVVAELHTLAALARDPDAERAAAAVLMALARDWATGAAGVAWGDLHP